MTILRALVALSGLALLGVMLWAAFMQTDLHGGFLDQLGVIATLPWGVASLVDVSVGFFLLAVVIYLTERSVVATALWAAPMLVIGNIWAAVWLAIRLPDLAKRLAREDWPSS